MISTNGKKGANAVRNKSVRPCDSCIEKRARWYCAADDAFLCQSCDLSVHSANPLARRHERVRLKSLDLLVPNGGDNTDVGAKKKAPSWHEGFTRKARTPRYGKSSRHSDDSPARLLIRNILQVPEEGSDDQGSQNEEEIDQQLLYRVPVFDHFVPANADGFLYSGDGGQVGRRVEEGDEEAMLKGILTSGMDLADFAADVENLFGRGLEKESCPLMDELGLTSSFKEEKEIESYRNSSFFKVKVEERDQEMIEQAGVDRITKELLDEIDLGREGDGLTLDLDLDFPHDEEELSPVCSAGEDDVKSIHVNAGVPLAAHSKKMTRRKVKILLSLDYEAVITAWGHTGGSPWTTGSRPEFDVDESWPDHLGSFISMELPHHYHRLPPMIGGAAHSAAMFGDGGREARVSRYREKRRTRLFSKKIRYEVRKRNAEKRPRMKGRFVKRATPADSPAVSHPLFK